MESFQQQQQRDTLKVPNKKNYMESFHEKLHGKLGHNIKSSRQPGKFTGDLSRHDICQIFYTSRLSKI